MEEKLDLTQIHHINLLVRDIEAAKQSYRDVFNVDFIDEALPSRGVLTSRFKVGDAWLVLVQPVAEGLPMRQLREQGDGLFLLSLAVTQTEACIAAFSPASWGLSEVRQGVSGWRVADLHMGRVAPGQLQLTFTQTD